MKEGYEFGKLGLILLDKYDAREWLAQVYIPIYALINNWNEQTDKTLQPLQESYHIGLETGAVEFACINANLYCIAAYLTGKQFKKTEAETKAYSEPKSILGLPIINQGKFIGILYLENNITTGAFTQSRIELLALLSGQIAVSIDNAMLYENLEHKVEERTAELIKEKRKSDKLLLNILPTETADELKQFGKAAPRSYESVTVMFTDFKDFSNISEQLTAEQLVDVIDTCFGAFDTILVTRTCSSAGYL